eukprot:scaffold22276_cov140-Isochrysis_galbana.AAC.2
MSATSTSTSPAPQPLQNLAPASWLVIVQLEQTTCRMRSSAPRTPAGAAAPAAARGCTAPRSPPLPHSGSSLAPAASAASGPCGAASLPITVATAASSDGIRVTAASISRVTTARPAGVIGTTSPKPTVVSVVTEK